MYGFYIYIGNHKKSQVKEHFSSLEVLSYRNFIVGYQSFSKFNDDKLFCENEQYIIGLDGVILNKKELIKRYAATGFSSLIIKLYKQKKSQFPNQLKGVFSGFVFKKENQSLFFFNDQVATKQVFYAKENNYLFIAPNLKFIAEMRSALGFSNELDIQASYTMLSFGGMLENQTLVKDIYKLGAGECLSYNDRSIKVERYHDFNEMGNLITDKKKAIELLDETFQEALRLEYEKDKEYHYKSIATLSGGLDSRMNVMLANKMAYKPDTFCFSQSGYADEKIAAKIAGDLQLSHTFIPLDGGDYLKNLNEMVGINSGLQFYHGSAHYHFALQQLDLKEYGLMHTGQIGDGILGGFVYNRTSSDYLSKINSDKYLEKIKIAPDLFKNYSNEEVFKLHQRVFNLANFGSYMVEQHQTYLVSPFFDVEVIKTALSIERGLKIKQDIYIDWINSKYPEVARYRWEKTGFKPNAKWKTRLSRYTNKLKKEYYQMLGQEHKLSMNPIDYWLKTNPSIPTFYQNYFTQNKNSITQKELYDDFEDVMQNGKFMEKAIVLTILELVRSLSLEVPE